MRRALAFLLLAAACSPQREPAPTPTASPSPTAPPTPTFSPSPSPRQAASAPKAATPVPCAADGCFDVARAREHDRVLSVEIGIRRTGQPGDRRAADYVLQQLRASGLDARLVAFTTPAGHETWNVVAPVDTSRPYLIVGAHYDTVANSPGGNDNGTGTSAVIELARALRAQPAPLPIVFVAFGAEEIQPGPRGTHHLGSRAYVDAMTPEAKRNLVAVVSLDEIGFGRSIVCGRMSVGPREATNRLLRLAGKLAIPARERVTPDWSDNGPFLRAGLNAGWLWSGEDPSYHSPRDTFEHVQWDSVERAGRLALAFLRSY